ncbi:transposase, partial [Elusimicrobiota bacterium]
MLVPGFTYFTYFIFGELYSSSIVLDGMPRPLRIQFPGALFHLSARGNGGQDIFLDDRDRERFLRMLAAVKKRCKFLLYAYCLMSNHFHLLLETREYSATAIMHRFLTRYAKYLNRRKGSVGHVFQDRFYSKLCQKNEYFLELLRYLHHNPLRAGIVDSPSKWPWSSHLEYIGRSKNSLCDLSFPLSLFDADPQKARQAYSGFLGSQRHDESAPGQIQAPCWEIPVPPIREIEMLTSKDRKSLEDLGLHAAWGAGVTVEEMRGRSRRRCLVPA